MNHYPSVRRQPCHASAAFAARCENRERRRQSWKSEEQPMQHATTDANPRIPTDRYAGKSGIPDGKAPDFRLQKNVSLGYSVRHSSAAGYHLWGPATPRFTFERLTDVMLLPCQVKPRWSQPWNHSRGDKISRNIQANSDVNPSGHR